MNHLAKPAPMVEAASATDAPRVNPVRIEDAQEVEPATADKASRVEPAAPFNINKDAAVLDEEKNHSMSVKKLRGKTGADFESVVAVLRGAPKKNFLKKILPFLYDERDFVSFGEVKRYVVVKGDCCFVFTENDGIQPLYAIPLSDFVAIQEDPKNPDKHSVTISPVSATLGRGGLATVLLKYSDGSQGYQFTFDTSEDRSVAKRFLDLFNVISTSPQTAPASILSGKAAKNQYEKEKSGRKK